MQFYSAKILYINIGDTWFILEDKFMALTGVSAARAVDRKKDEGFALYTADSKGADFAYYTPPVGKDSKGQAAVLGYNTSTNGGLNILS